MNGRDFAANRMTALWKSCWAPASVVVLLVALVPRSARACAACYGQSDSPMAAGMNWGILSLLAIIVCVLGGIAAFFVFLARRSVAESVTAAAEPAFQSAREL